MNHCKIREKKGFKYEAGRAYSSDAFTEKSMNSLPFIFTAQNSYKILPHFGSMLVQFALDFSF